ncbi:MAG: fibronectin type III domain-containing protein [Solirubrobacteraceae bacterium]
MALMRFSGQGLACGFIASLCACLLATVCLAAPALAVAPTVEEESFSDMGSSSAVLSAQINTGESAVAYRFEYGTSTSYGSSTPLENVPSNPTVTAQAELSGLQPNTVYHFRVVVTNMASETTLGADTSFTTFQLAGLQLPDGRVDELVTPQNNYDADVYVTLGVNTDEQFGHSEEALFSVLPMQAASDGHAVVYAAGPTTGGNGSSGEPEGNSYMATRIAEGVWTQTNISPPGNAPVVENRLANVAFSADLSVGFVSANETALSPTQPKGLYTYATPGGPDVPIETPANATYAGASTDLQHVIFESKGDLYDSLDGQVHQVDVLPSGTASGDATYGSLSTASENGSEAQLDFSHVISAAGNRVFWTDLNTGTLYTRENDAQPQSPMDGSGKCIDPADACTIQIDASQAAGSGGHGVFLTASTDGSKVFFADSDAAGLTSDTVPGSGVNLYEYDVLTRDLTDLTPGPQAGLQGVVGTSETGSFVYFVAEGAFAPGASGGQDNLYVEHNNVTTYIAHLSLSDGESIPPYGGGGKGGAGTNGDWQSDLGHRTAEVTPDGASLLFMSQERLTAYDNSSHTEVYLYDAAAQRIACVSCNPSGESPESTIAGRTTGAYIARSTSHVYMRRSLTTDGDRIFFDSIYPLVPTDTNGKVDVYEWERAGTGSCDQTAAGTAQDGCIYLLSGGTSGSDSSFIDASESGNDVFVATRAKLSEADLNENYDLYDSHVGGVVPQAVPSCTGSGCQGVPPGAPIFATPASVTFTGVGNFPAPAVKSIPKSRVRRLAKCKRGYVRRGKKCVKHAKRSRTSKGRR